MCGIAGIFHLNGRQASAECLKIMGHCTIHRGPDNFGLTTYKNIGMAHNRLSLLDLSDAANQPFENDEFILAYNGEIYNFSQIRERLARDHNLEFKTTSDTEVLFYSLIYDGVDECLKQIKGMFAFAFYIKKDGELYLARDRYGIKPLYYSRKQDGFYWASEIKTLAAALDLTPDPIRTLFSVNGIAERSNEFTLFKEVCSVKPGSYLKTKSNEKPKEFIYYDVLDEVDEHYYRELDEQSSANVVAEFERLFTESVQKMLMSDAPMGAFVSGGIDSSLISVVAAESYANLKLFTANVVGRHSEYEDAKLLAKHIGKDLYEYKFQPEMILSDWAEATYFYECPIVVHANALPFFNIARLARDSNVKAVLTGEGADELFLGYPKLLTKRYNRLAMFPIETLKSMYKFVPGLREYLFPEVNRTALKFVNSLVQNFELEMYKGEGFEKLSFLSKAKQQEQLLTLSMFKGHLLTLLHRNDRMGMMSSIEARFPFLDEELVKFAVNLPSKYKIGRSIRFHNYRHPFLIDKWIVRKVAEKYLPKQLYSKKKNGFSMFGLKNVRLKKGFFDHGWVAETLSMGGQAQGFMLEKQDPYFIAKLASVEIFGQIFAYKKSHQAVKNHILKYAEFVND